MKRKLLITAWLLVPIVLLAYHYGPGQQSLARERAARLITQARAAEQSEDWTAAYAAWGEALAALPADDIAGRLRIRLAQADARVWLGELPESIQDLESLLADAQKAGDPRFEAEVRAALAAGNYYVGWLMRLEGAETAEWTAPVEEARQHFRLLAEQADAAGERHASEDQRKNLEAVIRLARMDLSELQGLPLPKKCSGCKNCSQKCRSQRESQCKNPGEKKPEDARKAGTGKRPDGTGS